MAILDDLNRIIIRATIIRPLAQGLLSYAGSSGGDADIDTGGAGGSDYNDIFDAAAKGAAFDGQRSNFFRTGGVVTGRTAFKYGAGFNQNGIMGEAGPEAILPLRRDSGGNLGVMGAGGGGSNVQINIINNSGAEVTTSERKNGENERVIDVLIVAKVKEGLANGSFDKQFSSQYGLRRKGA
jgi:lambda family phage tail tape measure protein